MTAIAAGGTRDRRIEDPSNLWLIHPAGRALLPLALRLRVSANMVSLAGLACGTAAAIAYARADDRAAPAAFALLGLLLSLGWLVMDGLDGMVARATGTSSPLGRLVDGLCDHGTFVLIYVTLALGIGTAGGWALAIAAGAAHALQSNLYEGERARFHRRAAGVAAPDRPAVQPSRLLRAYDALAALPQARAAALERRLAATPDPAALGRRYAAAAVAPMRLLALQTANVRVVALFVASLHGDPRLFWWFEIGPLSIAAIAGLAWHRHIERVVVAEPPVVPAPASSPVAKEQDQDG